MAKALSQLVSGILFLAISLAAITLVYQGVQPGLQSVDHQAAVNYMSAALADLDLALRSVALEGEGSRRELQISLPDGELAINGSADKIVWSLATQASFISPRSAVRKGNAVLGSQLLAAAYAAPFPLQPSVAAYVLENDRLKVFLRKAGNHTRHVDLATNGLVLGVYQKDLAIWLASPGFVYFSVDGQESSRSGTGYTALAATGPGLPYAQATVFINSTYLPYFINFTLLSGADFIQVQGARAE
ncbi:MAG: hypothetical protein HY519_00515 [Candidatus Aenigmarchaeota archaeon]|nr:hypothetical protein [Candidatus Aenigmarchaeota archaeon]